MPRFYFDFETRSAVDLRDVGAFRYAEDPTTEALCMAYAIDNDPVQLWKRGDPMPALPANAEWVAHNIQFDALIFEKTFGVLGVNLVDTMAKCNANNIPASLGSAAEFLGLPYKKDTKGKVLLGRLSRPKSTNPLVWYENDEVLEQLYAYCKQDVETLRALDRALPALVDREKRVWNIDRDINNHGMMIDRELVDAAIHLVAENKNVLDHKIRELTGGAVNACSEVKKLTEWIIAQGGQATSLAKGAVAEALLLPQPDTVKEALQLRQQYAKSSTAKLATVLDCLSSDGRLRGQFVYHGAGTGRWAGRHAQPQNFPRLKVDKDTAEHIIQSIKARDVETLTQFNSSILDVISGVLRGIIVAEKGYKLVGADLSSIEARVVAWLAGANDILDVFRRGDDVYCYTAQRIYGRHITKDDKAERFIGKVAQLALGYQGGVGSFVRMASVYGVSIPEEKAKEIVEKWREANPLIVWYWREIERAAFDAMGWPGKAIPCGKVGRAIHFKYEDPFLKCRLPSGRVLYYPKAIVKSVVKFGKKQKVISYAGELAGRVGNHEVEMYGGKWTENVTQAIARDVMTEGMMNLVHQRVPLVGTVHDEIICEVAKDFPAEDVVRAMTAPIMWAPGLPLAAEGWSGERYLKG